MGGQVGTSVESRHKEFDFGGMRNGYDCGRAQELNVKHMLQHMKHKEILGLTSF